MARLASQAAAGFFPTPPRVVQALCNHLEQASPQGHRVARGHRQRVIRLLDPCAGRGDAAAAVARALSAESYGIELNTQRAERCRRQVDHVLATSAFSVRLANGAFSCLWLNPPYDYDDDKRRLEHAFLTTLSRALAPDGLLLFLVPQRRLAVSARYLASHYSRFVAYRFPDPEYGAFGQIVLCAHRKTPATLDPAAQAMLERWSVDPLPPLPDQPEHDAPLAAVRVPAVPGGEILFSSLFFDPAQAAAEAKRRGAWVLPRVAEQLWPEDERPVQPLMPLRRGHLALLIAAGMLNNVVLRQDGHEVLVKGRTYKELVPVDTDDEQVEITRERLRTSVQVLNLRTGMLEMVTESGSVAAAGPVGVADTPTAPERSTAAPAQAGTPVARGVAA